MSEDANILAALESVGKRLELIEARLNRLDKPDGRARSVLCTDCGGGFRVRVFPVGVDEYGTEIVSGTCTCGQTDYEASGMFAAFAWPDGVLPRRVGAPYGVEYPSNKRRGSDHEAERARVEKLG